MTRPAGEKALAQIREFEGLRLKAYRDTGGVLTIGYGHTSGVKAGQEITREDAERLLRGDVLQAEQVVARHVDAGQLQSLPQGAYDALVDMAFNLGDQVFASPRTKALTGLSQALKASRLDDVPAQMMRWVYDNGRKLDGLVRRRKACADMWREAFR